ncbi:NAD-dependent succinate-semialdehyde dehydrogenase [Mesorhizobium qingshengii]|uniref:NAD-dependent succinate-semialdehyde dehydrogenase n=1 Tax=Mesorhizobium qingshengii TaxID=1165689 RepID=A0ABT4QW34_9HYPH|nr:NAD-dependent succinate-semialdehyde dehydrogenase [Mesorhizobium qingshengii]MCZ8545804.1 NAD-dependent succinate-semialdehyde dehydrogenase [Mesorhizobium qingshengii]
MYENYGLFIENRWRPAGSGETRAVVSPVTGEPVGHVPNAAAGDIDTALAGAEVAFSVWRAVPAWERGRTLAKASSLIRMRADAIARMISTETGKPLAESMGEINATADQFEWYGEEAKRIYGQIIPGRNATDRMSVTYQPVGVCLSLSAWNFPALLPGRKIAAALAAGCSVVARPASEAPGACFAIAQALMDAGLPSGVLTILTGDPGPISERLIASPVVRKVSLTGSVRVGKHILSLCAAGMKKVTMELGGHAPVIVHADADPVATAERVAAAKFRNGGQVCISPSRFYVHVKIKREFEAAFKSFAEKLVIGDGLSEGVTMGPLIRPNAVEQSLGLVEDAVKHGAKLLTGGRRPSQFNKGNFLEPTVLTDVPDEARIMQEEPFAPVAPIAGFSRLEDVICRANSVPFGLASYVFTHDDALAALTAEGIDAGMVGVNETMLATAEAPFGGIKESGFGREGGSLGIMDYLEPKYIRHRLAVRGAV